MKILEYMALGKAVVAPRQENIQELLHEPEEAQFFTQGDVTSLMDALVTLVRDRQRRIDTGLRAKAAITGRGYLWTTNAQRVIEISESALRLSSVSVEPESASRF
jgi:glycosyltransferase involved in cell wall biosynthesis